MVCRYNGILCCAVLTRSCPTLCNPMGCSPPGSAVHGDSPGKNIIVGSHALLQGIVPTQGSNPGLLHCRRIPYHLNHQGSPRILEWVAYPFSRGFSQPRNWAGVSCIAGRFFTSWATREAPNLPLEQGNWTKQNWNVHDGREIRPRQQLRVWIQIDLDSKSTLILTSYVTLGN